MMGKSHSHFSVNQWRKCHHGVRARTLQDNWLFKDITLLDFTRHAFLSTSLALQSKFAELWDVELFLLELGSCPGSNLLDFHSSLVIALLHFSNKTAMLALQTCPTRCTESRWKKVRQETTDIRELFINLAGFEFTLMVAGESGLGKSTLIDRW